MKTTKYTPKRMSKSWVYTLLTFALTAVLLAACGGNTTPTAPGQLPVSTRTGQDGNQDKSVAAAKAFLANKLDDRINAIQLVGVEPVQWPDGCLGVQTPGIMCAMHVVDGYKITLSAQGKLYIIHSNLDGSENALEPNPVFGT